MHLASDAVAPKFYKTCVTFATAPLPFTVRWLSPPQHVILQTATWAVGVWSGPDSVTHPSSVSIQTYSFSHTGSETRLVYLSFLILCKEIFFFKPVLWGLLTAWGKLAWENHMLLSQEAEHLLFLSYSSKTNNTPYNILFPFYMTLTGKSRYYITRKVKSVQKKCAKVCKKSKVCTLMLQGMLKCSAKPQTLKTGKRGKKSTACKQILRAGGKWSNITS